MSTVGLDSYTVFKIFDIFRDRFLPIINSYRKDEHETSIYNHLFLAPESFSKKRALDLPR